MYNAFVDAFDKLQVALGILNVEQRPWWTHNARLWECGVDVSTVFAITNMKNPTKESSHQNPNINSPRKEGLLPLAIVLPSKLLPLPSVHGHCISKTTCSWDYDTKYNDTKHTNSSYFKFHLQNAVTIKATLVLTGSCCLIAICQ